MPGDPVHTIRVWDLPTRVFHWCLAACVVGLLVTGKVGGAAMPWHSRMGYAVGALLLFRLAWGLVGGHWSRFRAFTYSPRSVAAYLRGEGEPAWRVGHTPLGAASVYALLLFLAAQVATGLFSDDRADFTGPLSVLVSNQTVRLVTGYHKSVGQAVLITLVLLHVAAIAYYRFGKGQNLVGPMWHGDKVLSAPAPSARDDARGRWLALLLLGLAAAIMAGLVSLGAE